MEVFQRRGLEAVVRSGLTREELAEEIPHFDGIAVRSATKVTSHVINAGPRLKVIGRAGIGVDNIDMKAATAKGVVVMNAPHGNAVTTAEHAIALMFAAARQIPAADASTQAGQWEKSRFLGAELYGKTLGLIGCGNIGGLVAERAHGLKMHPIAYDPYLTEERALVLGVEKVTLEELIARADIVSLHTPLTDKTRNIISREAIGRMRMGVIIVNAARGGLVDEAALREALDSGHVRAAACDVFTSEPATENVLFGAPNFVATPHLGAATVEAQENVAVQIADQMSDFLLTGAVTNALNMPSISAEDAPRLRPWIDLAHRLGLLAGQMVETSLQRVEIAALGKISTLDTKPLIAAALAGVLKPMLSDVNMVSGPAWASERGICIADAREDRAEPFESMIRLTVETERRRRVVCGAIFGGEPRVVSIDGVGLEAPLTSRMLYVENQDLPGFIGRLGQLLGEEDVNIATFSLGRETEGGRAKALLSIDRPVDAPTLARVRALPHVNAVQTLDF
jgi:D-3-phosphoglycerate dehydrogenase